ncbi:MAG: hypothetical protein AAFP86_02440 [Planctomycetota bacterium]
MSPPTPAALAALLAPIAGAQTSPAHGLLGPGTVLDNGSEVEQLIEGHVTNAGSWAMHLRTVGGPSVVVRDGTVVMQPGDALSTGETVDRIRDIDVGPGGALAYALQVTDGSGFRDVVYSDGFVLLEEFASFVDPAVSPSFYSVRDFTNIAVAFPYLVVETRVSGGGATLFRDAVVRYDLTNAGAPVAVILAEESDPGPGITWGGRQNFPMEFDILPDGRTLFPWTARTGILEENIVVFDGVVAAQANQPAPDPGFRWGGLGANEARVSASGHLMLSGDVDDATTGSFLGRRIFVDDELRVDSGQPFGSGTTGAFNYRGHVDDQGRHHFTHQAGPLSGYALGGEVLMESGLARVDGIAMLGVSGSALQAISPDGRFVLLSASVDTAPTTSVYCLLETDLGVPVLACPTVPNSTGGIGRLEASGSSYIGAGAFPLTAVDLPAAQIGLLVCSKTPAFVPNPGGSAGNLCMGGSIGRFLGQIGAADLGGTLRLSVSAQALPQGIGISSAVSGEIWGFQVWHRDTSAGGPISNFTQTRAIQFL